jgi:ribosomal protein S18 acetylase RimI-like enzyme
MPLVLRPALQQELPQIVTLMNAAFRGVGDSSDRGWCTEFGYIAGDRTNQALLAEDISAGALLLVPEEEPVIVGCVLLKRITPEMWYLGSLTVSPAIQNGGFGRKLLAAAEAYAEAAGASVIEMTVVNVRHTLIAWYERRGYRLTGEIRPFPYEDKRFGTPLRDDLAFAVLKKTLAD